MDQADWRSSQLRLLKKKKNELAFVNISYHDLVPRTLPENNGRGHYFKGDEWSIKIFNCSQNFTVARFAR